MTEPDPGAGSDDQTRLITATIAVTNYLMTHPGMPAIGPQGMRFSFPMPAGDDARVSRLAQVAAWLDVDPDNDEGTFRAYRDFGGISLGGHFTPQDVLRDRARRIFREATT